MDCRHGMAFVGLYVLLVIALLRPEMNISLIIDPQFFSAHYVAVMVLSYKIDERILLAALPLTALTVYASTKWNDEETEHPKAMRMAVAAIVGFFAMLVATNVASNGLVIQYALASFNKSPIETWLMYGQLQVAMLKSLPENAMYLVVRKPMPGVKLIVPLKNCCD